MRLKLATTKVVDLRVKADEPKAKAPNMPQSNKAVEALQRSQLEAAVLQRKGVEIREKLLKLVGEANTSFANFPSPVTTTVCCSLLPLQYLIFVTGTEEFTTCTCRKSGVAPVQTTDQAHPRPFQQAA